MAKVGVVPHRPHDLLHPRRATLGPRHQEHVVRLELGDRKMERQVKMLPTYIGAGYSGIPR